MLSPDKVPTFSSAEVMRELRRRKYEFGITITSIAAETGIDRNDLWHAMAGRRLSPLLRARLTPYLAAPPVAVPRLEAPARARRVVLPRTLPVALLNVLPPGIVLNCGGVEQRVGDAPVQRIRRSTLARLVRLAILEYCRMELPPVRRDEALAYFRGLVCPTCCVRGAASTAATNSMPGKQIPRVRSTAACAWSGYPEPSTWLGLPPVPTLSYVPSRTPFN